MLKPLNKEIQKSRDVSFTNMGDIKTILAIWNTNRLHFLSPSQLLLYQSRTQHHQLELLLSWLLLDPVQYLCR